MSRAILVLHEPPLPFAGAAARWYYVLVKGLAERGWEVTAFAPDIGDVAAMADHLPASKYDVRLFPPAGGWMQKWRSLRRPFSYTFSPAMIEAVRREVNSGCDVLHAEQIWGGWAVWNWPKKAIVNVHYLYAIDHVASPADSKSDRAFWKRAINAEAKIVRHFPNLFALTDRLSDRLRTINPSANVQTVPMGLNTSLYEFVPPKIEASNSPTLGLIGSFNWAPSYHAAIRLIDRLWPAIKQRVPAAKLLIVGRAARSALADRVANAADIEVVENVPEIIPHFRRLDALLYAPPAGSGMKVKIMEAMALGTPVVTNAEGAEGLHLVDNINCSLADSDDALVERAATLLTNPQQRSAYAHAARQTIEELFSASISIDRLIAAYARIG